EVFHRGDLEPVLAEHVDDSFHVVVGPERLARAIAKDSPRLPTVQIWLGIFRVTVAAEMNDDILDAKLLGELRIGTVQPFSGKRHSNSDGHAFPPWHPLMINSNINFSSSH